MKFSDINDFYSKIRGKKVFFIGIGVSHEELIFKCKRAGADVTLCDRRKEADIPEAAALLKAGINLKLGEDYLENIDADIVLRTPGMYYNHPSLIALREKGVFLTSEMELFFELCPCKIYAITGSDGKTTTSNIIAKMLERFGKKVYLGGNLGRALLPVCEQISKDDVAVVELSSFQLISMKTSPHLAVITNLSPNHLDVHGTMDEYIDAKRNIFKYQQSCDRLVLNLDNAITRGFSDEASSNVSYFSYKGECLNDSLGAFLSSEGYLCLKTSGGVKKIMHKGLIRIPGEHNVENYLTAIAAVGEEVGSEVVRYVAENFGGVEHRIELVRTLNSVSFYNDSIASSPTRTIAGLRAFNQKVILIAGGYDKKLCYDPLAPLICEKVSLLITLGATADKIEKSVLECRCDFPAPKIIKAEDMKQAVDIAYKNASKGDVVLLSPASASFDMYKNFECRGRHFKELVNAL